MKPADTEAELSRLLSGAADRAPASLVTDLRSNGPDASELASLATRLALQGIDANLPNAPARRAPRWRKWTLAGGGVAAVAATWFATRGVPLSGPHSVVRSLPTSVSESPRATTPAEKTGAATRRGTHASAEVVPGVPSPVVPAPIAGAIPSARTEAGTTAAEPVATLSNLPRGEPQPTSASEEPERSAPARALPVRSSPVATAASREGSALDASRAGAPSELSLLRDARVALSSSPAHALALAEDHARLYPSGKLTQERELIAISALVALGRSSAARQRAVAFEHAFPSSPYRKQLSDLLP